MFGLKPRGIGIVRLKRAEVRNRGCETCTLHEVPGGVSVAARPGLGQREIDHRPKHERRGERIFAGEHIRRRRQYLVMVAIELAGPTGHKPRGSLNSRPRDQECQCLKQTPVTFRMIERPLLGFDIVEVGKPLQPGAEMLCAERPLET